MVVVCVVMMVVRMLVVMDVLMTVSMHVRDFMCMQLAVAVIVVMALDLAFDGNRNARAADSATRGIARLGMDARNAHRVESRKRRLAIRHEIEQRAGDHVAGSTRPAF